MVASRMKPDSLTLSLIVWCCCGLPTACAEGPTGPGSVRGDWTSPPIAESWPSMAGHHPFGPPPLSASLPYGFLWDDYRGAAVEHDIYGIHWSPPHRYDSHPRPALRIFSTLFGWFDGLLCSLSPPRRPAGCSHCNSEPSFHGPTFVPESNYERQPRPALLKPAPDFSLDEPPFAQPPADSRPRAVIDVPQPVPVPQPDDAESAPIVELVPDFVLPPETPKAAPPRNRIPSPSGPPPRNIVPR
jgi:hypothetical protein